MAADFEMRRSDYGATSTQGQPEFDVADVFQPRNLFAPVEHDRFIPHRQATAQNNFDAKEILFAKGEFACSHTSKEACDCA